MIRNVIFDMGNVILSFDPDEILCHFSDSEKERAAIKEAVFSHQEWGLLDKGMISEQEAKEKILSRLSPDYQKTAECFLDKWDQYLPIFDETFDLICELKEKHYNVYLLSNASLRFHQYQSKVPALQMMDGIIVSADHLCVKPETEIYEKLFSVYHLNPEECFFIDDLPQNIEAGKKLKMNGYCYSGNMESLRQALYQAGIPVSVEKDFKIVPVKTDEQIKQLEALAEEIWNQHFIPIIGKAQVDYMLLKFQSYDALKNQLTKQGYEYFFSCYNGKNIGYTGIKREADSLFLSKLYFKKAYRGRNLSRQVLDFLVSLCKENGLKKIWLTVNRHNLNTIAIYQKLGFHITEESASDIGNGFVMDDYIMEKPII